jgi:probable HAF family extracellular repeat protein
MKKTHFLILTLFSFLSYSIANATEAGYSIINKPSGVSYIDVYDITDDSSTIVGYYGDGSGGGTAFRWNSVEGAKTDLGSINGGNDTYAFGVNSSGSVIVGQAEDGLTSQNVAFRWTNSTGMQSLGVLNSGTSSLAHDLSSDGNIIIGIAADGADSNHIKAFMWTSGSGMQSLGTLAGDNYSGAIAISNDGSTVIGDSYNILSSSDSQAFRWTSGSGMVSLGNLNGGTFSAARGISADGSTIVGYAADGADGITKAFSWRNSSDGMQSLGLLHSGSGSFGYNANSDGSIIVGSARDGTDSDNLHAFRWDSTNGMQSIKEWLQTAGVDIGTDNTAGAYVVNRDGTVIVGQTTDDEMFIARTSSYGTGLVTVNDLMESITQSTAITSPQQIYGQTRFVMHGLHSTPLVNRIEKGKTSLWANGDLGLGNNKNQFGGQSFGLGELGISHAFNPTQLSLSLGQGFNNSKITNNASQTTNSFAILSSLSRIAKTDLYLNVDLLYQSSNINTVRGYNTNSYAGSSSSGSTRASTKALRLRLDWENLVKYNKFAITPYVESIFGSSKTNGYTEHGGGFPINYDARKTSFRDKYFGTDLTYQLTKKLKLRTKLEGGYLYSKDQNPISGEIIGLSNFSLAGHKTHSSWKRVGLGFEYELKNSKIFSMVNSSKESGKNNNWVNVFYQVKF